MARIAHIGQERMLELRKGLSAKVIPSPTSLENEIKLVPLKPKPKIDSLKKSRCFKNAL